MKTNFEFSVHGPENGSWITLSHPIGADMNLWAGQIEFFAKSYRVLAYNTRGHGRDMRKDTQCTVDDLAADVLQLWKQLGINRSHFVGLSLGGCVGVALAYQAPQMIESLTVACSRLEMDPAATAMWQQRAKQVEEQGMAPIAAATLERWLTPDFMSKQPEKTQQIRQTLIDTPPQGFAACARALADMHQLQRLAGLQVRTLFIGGSKDMAVPCATVKQYALMNPLFSFHELEGPHILNMENPIGFQQTITDFISQL